MRKINRVILAGLTAAASLSAASYEYPQLYKDTKYMGAGGVAIGGGGQTTSVFYNTAGLSKIPKEYGIEIDLLNVGVVYNDNIVDFTSDLSDAGDAPDANGDGDTDPEETEATLDVMEKYLGENLHMSVNAGVLSIGKKLDEYAFGIVPFGGTINNFTTHRGFGSEGVMTAEGIAYGGVALGLSKDIKDAEIGNYVLNNFAVGVGGKYVSYAAWNHNFTISELVDDDFDIEDVSKDGSSTVFDLGAQYEILPNVTAGLAVQNIGGVGDSEAVEVPMTVGVGVSYGKRFDRVFFNDVKVGFDYIDIANGYEQDKDYMKRTRFGMTGNVIDGWAGALGLQLGMYQGHYTAGLDIRLFILKLAYTTYAEEVGAYSGQEPDRRHMVNISMGW